MKLYPLHPVYALLGIGLCAGLALLLASIVPFYKREMKVENATRLTPLDGLRGLLCFGVMYHHAAVTYTYLNTGKWNLPPSAVFYTLLGQTSVALFFCTTGFLFWSQALHRKGRLDTLTFLRARFFRIAPLYLFSCVVALAVVARQIPWLSPVTGVKLLKMAALGLYSWPFLGTAHLGMVNAGVTWTLAYEWAFYFALPVLALVIVGNGSRKLPLLAVALYLIFGIGVFTYFLSGILAAYVARRPQTAQALQRPWVSVGVFLLLIALPRIAREGSDYKAIILTTLIFVPIACGNSLLGLLNTKGLRLMGLVSYSVYLLHGIVLYAARFLLVRYETPAMSLYYWSTVYLLALGVLLISLVTYRWVEWPFITFEKKHRSLPATETQQVGTQQAIDLVKKFLLLK